MNKFFDIITKPFQWTWSGIKFLYKSKLMVALPVATLCAGVLATALAPASMAALEFMTFGLYATVVGAVGYTVGTIYYGHLLRKEKRLVNKIEKLKPSNELAKGLSKEKAYKLSKKFAQTHLKLAKMQCSKSRVNNSFFSNTQGFSSSRLSKLNRKISHAEAEELYTKILGAADELANAKYRKAQNRLRSLKSLARETDEQLAPTAYAKPFNLPSGDIIENKNSSINCHKESTKERFVELAKKDYISKDKECIVRVSFNKNSALKPTEIRLMDRELLDAGKDILIDEARELAQEGKDVFPLVLSATNKYGRAVDKKITSMDELNKFDEELGF